jgi:molecular chaperone DnaK
MSSYIDYAIDLGTTNSSIALCDGNEVRIFQNNDNMNVTPSAVHVLKSGRIIVGARAMNKWADDPDNIALEFKRSIGQKYVKTFPASGRVMSAEELSAVVLKSLREDVQRQTGKDVMAAVVTVPAAFGTLQCEATARAAGLAGLEDCPLLQEPIAAAVAYGAKPGAADQRWIVFDLGGGTLDIAIVSTRDGRLNVLEHRGNNRLGGKDIDRAVVEELFLPALGAEFSLPDAAEDRAAYDLLWRRLARKAEDAKKDLSTSEQVVVSLFDLGEDREGTPMEIELTLTRRELEEQVDPLLDRCVHLAREALDGARISGADLDRILLVGGPTQIPFIRSALRDCLGANVDHSVDPMTVVARGAALYASTIERAVTSPKVGTKPGALAVSLAFDRVSASLQCPVAGRIDRTQVADAREVKIDAEGGYWSSGWQTLSDGCFEIPVTLQEGKGTRFWVYARDSSGRLLEVEPGEFSIRHGLEVSAPPLPHTISVEVVRSDGRAELDPIFRRNTPLPVENTYAYRAAHTLRPSEPDSSLAIKLWEGEELSDPDANEWVGYMRILAEEARRPIPEGSEIELSIKVDSSRLITVEVFVPHLNQHFAGRAWLPQDEERSPSEVVASLPQEVETYVARLDRLETQAVTLEDDGSRDEIERLRREVEDIDIQLSSESGEPLSEDHDRQGRLLDASREIRRGLTRLERGTGGDEERAGSVEEAEAMAALVEEVAQACGTPLDQQELALLRRELDRATNKGDQRGVRKVTEALNSLRWRILFKQDWFWREVFDSMREPGVQFQNDSEARRWLAHGDEAIRRGDSEALREAVRQLWELQPRSEMDKVRESAIRSGLRKH